MKSLRIWFVVAGVALEAVGFFTLSAPAVLAANVTSTWSTATSGNWNVDANWTNAPSLGGFPNNSNGGVATYDAVINSAGSPYTVTLSTNATVEDLLLNSANATLSQTSGMLTATGAINLTAGTFSLVGGTIANSTVNAAVPISLSSSGGTLSGVTVNGDLSFPAAVFNPKGLIADGATFTTAHLAGNYSAIGFAPAQTLSGTIQFEGAGDQSSVTLSSAGTFTVGASGVIKTVSGLADNAIVKIGSGGFAYNADMALINNGLISSQVSGRTLVVTPATSFTNAGALEAKSGGVLTIAPTAAWTNAGTISVNAATVNLGGTFNATGGIGAWINTGGTVNVTGTVNAGSGANTLTLNNATGSWSMAGGTINGGTLAFADNQTLKFTSSGGTLSGVTVNGDLSFPAAVFNPKGLIADGATFTTAHLAGNYSAIGFAPAQTLSGTIQFEGAGDQSSVTLSSAGTFTVGASGVIKTIDGLAANAIVKIGSGGFAYNADMALINNGLISSQVSGRTLVITPATSFTNAGVLEAKSGGILSVPSGYTQTAGTTRVASGGTILAIDPIIVNKLNTITFAGGRLEGNGTLTANVANSATIAPGLSAGALSINGDLTLAATSTLQVDIGGAQQGVDHAFLSEAGAAPLNLAGALSVVRISGYLPTAADSLIILSSNQPITGMFSNVVGGRVTATDGITSLKVSVVGAYVVLGELPGDYNGDGVVDGADFLVWQQGLGGKFTLAHLDVWKMRFGSVAASGAAPSATGGVPEPTSAVMLFVGTLGALAISTRLVMRPSMQ